MPATGRRPAPGGEATFRPATAGDELLSCVHCGLCLPACPTYAELGDEAESPRGRILLMRALAEGRLEPTAAAIAPLDRCLGCRACEPACPSGVRYGRLLEASRARIEPRRSLAARAARAGLAAALAHPLVLPAALAPLRALARGGALGRLARRLPRARWLALAAALPTRAAPPLPPVLEPEGDARGTAVLLRGCVADALFRPTTLATARLLVRAGVRVLLPASTGCCGALALHLGREREARARASRLLGALGGIDADWIVATAAGCGALLREYDGLLPDDARARRVAARAIDPLALLDELGLPDPPVPVPARVAVHDPCHLLHAQGVGAAVRRLLAAVRGIELVPLAEADVCCGSAGTYNLTEPAMASRLLARKLDRIEASGARIIAAANPGCVLQIRAGATARGFAVAVEHPIDLLARAHGLGAS